MSLLYFPWSYVGDANQIEVTEHAHIVRHQYAGGYSASRPNGTRIQKSFFIAWESMNPDQWLTFISFWRSVGGPANAFYFTFPYEIYGGGGYGGYGGIEPYDGFDSEVDTGYGEGPILRCRFENSDQPQKYKNGFNLWYVETTIREVA